MAAGGNSVNDLTQNQLTKFRAVFKVGEKQDN